MESKTISKKAPIFANYFKGVKNEILNANIDDELRHTSATVIHKIWNETDSPFVVNESIRLFRDFIFEVLQNLIESAKYIHPNKKEKIAFELSIINDDPDILFNYFKLFFKIQRTYFNIPFDSYPTELIYVFWLYRIIEIESTFELDPNFSIQELFLKNVDDYLLTENKIKYDTKSYKLLAFIGSELQILLKQRKKFDGQSRSLVKDYLIKNFRVKKQIPDSKKLETAFDNLS